MCSNGEDFTPEEVKDIDNFTVLDETEQDADATPDIVVVNEDEHPVVTTVSKSPIDSEDGEKEGFDEVDDNLEEQSEQQQATEICEDRADNSDGEHDKEEDLECLRTEENVEEQNDVKMDDIILEEEEDHNNVSEVDATVALHDNSVVSEVSEVKEEEEEAEESDTATHPYSYLIDTFEFPKDQLNLTTVGSVKTIDETAFYMISSTHAFMRMLQSLRNAKEIGLDMQISQKDYQGIVCLIEISTKDTDYCIDAIKLKHELLMLTEIFINPKILKILVCAQRVLTCLQQRLHLYMVNIFDVDAARAALSLSSNYALSRIIKENYDFDRGRLHNPDFTKRPVPEDYKTFCRAGSHYLIYIYHDYKNKLILRNPDLYKTYLEECRSASKIIYSDIKTMALNKLEDELKNRHKCELEVLKKLFKWRMSVAKKKNIRPEGVLQKPSLMILVKNLPTTDTEMAKLPLSQHLRNDFVKIQTIIHQTKMQFNIQGKTSAPKSRKRPQNFPGKEKFQQGNMQLKRKLSTPEEGPSKQKRIDFPHNKGNQFQKSAKKMGENEKFGFHQHKQKLMELAFNKNKMNAKQTNKNPNQFRINPFMNQTSQFNRNNFNAGGQNTKGRKQSRFDQTESEPSHSFSSNNQSSNSFNMNMSNPGLLNQSNVSSTFQSDSSARSFGSPDRNSFDGPGINCYFGFDKQKNDMQMSRGNTKQMRMQTETYDDEDTLYRSLVDLKQARDNITMQIGNFDGKKYQNLNTLDQKINILEREVQQMRSRNRRMDNPHRKSDDFHYRRRY